MTFKGNRKIKRRHFGKPAAADDNKNGRTVLIGGLVNCFPLLRGQLAVSHAILALVCRRNKFFYLCFYESEGNGLV